MIEKIRYSLFFTLILIIIAACGGLSQTPIPMPIAETPAASTAMPAATTAAAPTAIEPPKALTKSVLTPPAELQSEVTKANLEAASKTLKTGADWSTTTSALVKLLGKPTYMLSPARNDTEEDWWWVVLGSNSQCVTRPPRTPRQQT